MRTRSADGSATVDPGRLLERARADRDAFSRLLVRLASIESPTDDLAGQARLQDTLVDELEPLGFSVRRLRGAETGGALYARPRDRLRGGPTQLLVVHSDTVWPPGTLETMPVEAGEGRVRGPGVFDAKGGIAVVVRALALLRAEGLEPEVAPLLLVNADEEIGSPETTRHVRRLARVARRAFVLEPALGPEGRVKTARKGSTRIDVRIAGRSAHAGLDPERGASAIVELSHVVQALHALNDPERGITVNVGTIAGGIRPNVIAADARAVVDVRVRRDADREDLERAIRSIEPATPGTSIEVGPIEWRPPLEPGPEDRALWEAARGVARRMGIALEEGAAGGVSDGNTTGAFTATLDGLGAVGDGAHATHEYVDLDRTVERVALLAGLLLLPPGPPARVRAGDAPPSGGGSPHGEREKAPHDNDSGSR